jgi:DNA invertase Pin-like site-specific DNA recombinase
VDQVVVHRLDRLARSLIGCVSLVEEFTRHDARLVIVTAPELGCAAQDNLVFNILASFAQFEREMIASRIAETRAQLKAALRQRMPTEEDSSSNNDRYSDPRLQTCILHPALGRSARSSRASSLAASL